jgi:uroporphyrin-III C-methyltransferase/precorrin-2 dehydrogenase/sirohydrochlorin ferrochelatase
MDYLPVFLKLRRRPCVVVGGGTIAVRVVSLLLRVDANVTVVAPELADAVEELRRAGRIAHRRETFSPDALDDCELVFATTGDTRVDTEVSQLARDRAIPVNVVDRPELCTFIMPAIVDRSPVVIALSTSGSSPVLARMLRARLETLIPPAYGRLAALARAFRERVKQAIPTARERRAFWESVLQGHVAELVLSGRHRDAEQALATELDERSDSGPKVGEVYLVGSGPGDPDLLTLRALRLLHQADVIVHDRLVTPAILDLARRDAERVYAGKQAGSHTRTQEEINALLVRLAREGKRVLRLKGGDPFIFGRGGEEIETLAEQRIPFQVVPGITAASGCAAYAGIPLTHRDFARSCVFVTGHLKNGAVNLDWDALARPDQTIVIYMGLNGLPVICNELIERGLDDTTPAALVQQGSTQNQRVFVGNLRTLPEMVLEEEAQPPTLIIVGQVVTLRDKLAWF